MAAEYLSSGSAIERAMICASSVALPHAYHESGWTARGTEIHAFLEECSEVGHDQALAMVPDEYREACASLNLEGLHVQLSLAAEVAFAYNVVTDTARELGRGAGRIYDDVGIDEIPCTLDVVGVRDLPNGKRRGLYTDWKSGYRNRRSIDAVTQIDFGALCVARAFDCDIVEGQLINVHEDFAPYVQRKVIERWELDAFASELREKHAEWKALREAWRAGVMPREFSTGPHCERCPAREFCPAQTALLRSVLSRDLFDGLLRMSPIPDADLVAAWDEIHGAQSALSMMKKKILGIASTRKLYLGRTSDGQDRWLGTIVGEGNDKLDGEQVFDVIASLPVELWRLPGVGEEQLTSEDVATKSTKITATKKDLDEAIRDAVPRGKKAAVLREIYTKLAAVGGIKNKVSVDVKEFTTKPALETTLRETLGLPAPPALPERDVMRPTKTYDHEPE